MKHHSQETIQDLFSTALHTEIQLEIRMYIQLQLGEIPAIEVIQCGDEIPKWTRGGPTRGPNPGDPTPATLT